MSFHIIVMKIGYGMQLLSIWIFCFIAFDCIYGAENKERLLKKLVEQALTVDPTVRYFYMEIEAAKGQQIQARLFPFPQFIGYIGPWNSSGSINAPSAFIPYGYQLYQLYQPLPFPGKLKSHKEIAHLDREIAELVFLRYKLFLAFKVYSLLYSIGLTNENLRVTEEIIERLSALITFLSQRPKIGIQGLIELKVLQGSLISFLQSQRDQQQNLTTLKSQLNALLNQSPLTPLPSNILPERTFPKLSLESLRGLALTHNPTILINDLLIRRAEKELYLAKLNAYPDFTAGPFWEYNKGINTDQGGGITFTVGIPFSGSNVPGQAGFAWTTNKGNIISAQAKVSQAHSIYHATVQMIDSLLGSRFAVYEKAQEQLLSLPSEKILEKLKEAAAIAERQYRVGSIDINRFLAVQKQYQAVSLSIRNTEIDLLSSFYELENIAGIEPSQTIF